MWNHHEDAVVFKDLPYYKSIIKGFLQTQIQNLLQQLAEETGEESVIMTVNMESGNMSHIGSKIGKAFLDGREDLKSQFLSYCISSCNQTNFGHHLSQQDDGQPPAKRNRKRPARKTTEVESHPTIERNNLESVQEKTISREGEVQSNTKKKHVSESDDFEQFMKSMEKSGDRSQDDSCKEDVPGTQHMNQSTIKIEPLSDDYQDATVNNAEHNTDNQIDSFDYEAREQFSSVICDSTNREVDEGVSGQMSSKDTQNDGNYDIEPTTNNSNKYLSTEGVVTLTKKGHVLRHKKVEQKPRFIMTFSEKFRILQDIEANPQLSHRQLAKRHNVGRTTIGLISKNRSYYKDQYKIHAESQRKKFTTTKYDNINGSVWKWYSEARSSGLLVSGSMVREKALEIAKELSEPDFKASNGWLGCWQSRYNVKTFRVSEETKQNAISVTDVSAGTAGKVAKNVKPSSQEDRQNLQKDKQQVT